MLAFFKRPESRIIIGIIWGLGLAAMFKKTCNGRKCIVIKTPSIKDVDNNQFKYEGDAKCYTYTPYYVSCNQDIKEENATEILKEEEFKNPLYM